MSNEWKELEIDNLPSDILTGDYELMVNGYDCKQRTGQSFFKQMIVDLFNGCEYQYRKPEPKPPTHEEIMTNWWETNQGAWIKPVCYHNRFYGMANNTFSVPITNQPKDWFTGRAFRDIPPEESE